jgi:DNA processing protein
MSEVSYWVGFNIVRGIGPVRFRALLDRFKTAQAAWSAPYDALRATGLGRRPLANLMAAKSRLDLEAEMARLASVGARVLTWESADYPRLLREIADSPPVLYVRGALREEDELAVALVGTRRASAYGRQVTQRLASALVRNGITIVSGLARGIDSEAHRAALEAGGRTIAVLGCGIDQVYPPENRRLAEQIAASGAVVTDYPFGTKPEGGNFPPRNRIISGLSLGVVVTEAGQRSGARITADYAGEQGRDVFAVPGSILSHASRGTNELIQDGAKLVAGPDDILEELNLMMVSQQVEARQVLPADDTEAVLLAGLSSEPTHVDEIQQHVGLPVADVTSALAMMELKGLVRQVGGMRYVVARDDQAPYRVD